MRLGGFLTLDILIEMTLLLNKLEVNAANAFVMVILSLALPAPKVLTQVGVLPAMSYKAVHTPAYWSSMEVKVIAPDVASSHFGRYRIMTQEEVR